MKKIYGYIGTFGVINFLIIVITLANPLGFAYLFCYLAIALLFLKRDVFKYHLDKYFFTILGFGVVYALFYLQNPTQGNQYVILYLLGPSFFYLWGKQLVTVSKDQGLIFVMIMIISLIYSLPALITLVLDITEGGFAQAERNIPMFWGGEPVTATGMAAFLMFNICIPGLLLAGYKPTPKILLILFIIVFVLSVASVLRLGSRTQLGIMILSLVLALIYVTPKFSFRQNFNIYVIIVAIIAFVANQISFDLESELFSSFAGRMSEGGAADLAGGGGRVDLWKKSLDFMQKYPFGWDKNIFGYSHNLLLDTYRVGSFIASIILLVFLIGYVRRLIKALKNSSIDVATRLLFLVYTLAFFSVFMVEPGIEGTITMFLYFFLFAGIVIETHNSANESQS